MAKYTLHSEWQQARLLAVTHHMSLVYCGSDDGLHCSSSWRRGRLLMTADRHHVIWYHQNNWHGIRWRQGVIMQRNGIVIAADGSLASSAGHFCWKTKKTDVQASATWRLTVQVSGVMHD